MSQQAAVREGQQGATSAAGIPFRCCSGSCHTPRFPARFFPPRWPAPTTDPAVNTLSG
jgi:hypothetical protein